MYLLNTRPDICFVVNTLRHAHLMVAKHAARYLKGTIEYGLKYEVNRYINLKGYVDSDWAGSSIDKKITLRCCFSMGLGVISWFRRMKFYVALSTSEAEHVATCLTSCDAVWLRKLLFDVFDLQLDATCMYCDN